MWGVVVSYLVTVVRIGVRCGVWISTCIWQCLCICVTGVGVGLNRLVLTVCRGVVWCVRLVVQVLIIGRLGRDRTTFVSWVKGGTLVVCCVLVLVL